jgi:O-antigen/teichoic acid export membrane protein
VSTTADTPAGPPDTPRLAPGRHRAARGGGVALIDQAVVSGTNFLTVILIGRSSQPEDLGYYSLGFALLVLLAALQEALVTAPYTVFRERVHGPDRAAYTGCVLAQQFGLAVLAAGVLAGAVSLADGWLGPAGWAVAAAAPAALLHQFCRRLAFADLWSGGALALDLGVAGLQLGGLLGLAVAGRLTAVTAFAVIGLAGGTVGLVGLAVTRRAFAFRGAGLGREVGRHWVFGRWVAAGQGLGVINGYVAHWLLAGLVGPAATGTFAACLAVVMLSNPFILGVSNLLGPRAVRARAAGGPGELRRVVGTAGLLVAGVMAAFALVLTVAGDPLVRLLYGGGYGGHGLAVVVLAAAVAASGPGIAADHGLRALERPRAAFAGSLTGFVVTVAAVGVLAPVWGVTGAAFGYLTGTAASSTVRAVAFLRALAEAEGGGA